MVYTNNIERNKEGYSLSLKYANKFDIACPVWFTIRFNNVVDGNQNVDLQWIKEIKSANPSILIVPRILIELQEKTILQQINDPQLVEVIVTLLQQYSNKFDGVMIETPYISFIDQLDAHDILTFLVKLKQKITQHNKSFKLILTLYGHYSPQQYQHSTLKKLFKLADYALIQTYDYQIQEEEYQLLSPYEWVQENLQYFMNYKTQLLFGLPFYGFKKTESQITHIIGKEIMELDSDNYTSEWDNTSSECIYKSERDIISYPCPKFIKYRLDLMSEFERGYFIWEGGQGLEQFYQLL